MTSQVIFMKQLSKHMMYLQIELKYHLVTSGTIIATEIWKD